MGCLSAEFFSATVSVDSLCDRSLQRLKTLFTLRQLQHHSLFIGSFSIYIPRQWQHHSIFIQHFSIYCGSSNITQFSYNTFPYTVAAATQLNFHTILVFQILWQWQNHSIFIHSFSICCGSGNNTNFPYICF